MRAVVTGSDSIMQRVPRDAQETNKLLADAAMLYLAGVKNDDGVPLLYAGIR